MIPGTKRLEEKLIYLSSLARDVIMAVMSAVEKKSPTEANAVLAMDERVDKLNAEIQELVLSVARECPDDIVSAIVIGKIAQDLERLVDHSMNVTRIALDPLVPSGAYEFYALAFKRMAEIVIEMLGDAVEAFINSDEELARRTAQKDDVLDTIYAELKRRLRSGQEKLALEETIDLMLAAKHLERMGDYVTNICEYVLLAISGSSEDLN
ncbi:transcriptional regulator [Coprothermobacteraceae bacterium]|nr:transcriptional regulator [Coprothermobacteraceae bacterium]